MEKGWATPLLPTGYPKVHEWRKDWIHVQPYLTRAGEQGPMGEKRTDATSSLGCEGNAPVVRRGKLWCLSQPHGKATQPQSDAYLEPYIHTGLREGRGISVSVSQTAPSAPQAVRRALLVALPSVCTDSGDPQSQFQSQKILKSHEPRWFAIWNCCPIQLFFCWYMRQWSKRRLFCLFSKRLFHRGMMALFNKQCKEHLVYTEENNKLIINNSVYTSYCLFFNSFSDLISF